MSTCRTARVMTVWSSFVWRLATALPCSLLRYRDGDLFRGHRRLVRHVILIGQQQLQRVLARGERHGGLGLALAEVNDLIRRRERGGEVRRRVGVDQQV